MKALVQNGYGSVDALEFMEVERPVPAADEVLVKVVTTAVNDWEWAILDAPLAPRLLGLGLRKPRRKFQVPGCDMAGRVESTGARVTKFAVGDEVYGDLSAGWRFGAFAEYARVAERSLVRKPATVSFEHAAAIPHAAELALQAIQAAPPLKSGQQVLVNGAGGGVGTLAIQLLKMHDVEVTAVDRKEKLAVLRSLGCDHVIEYPEDDFTTLGRRYDLILDTKSSRSPLAYIRVLKPEGAYITVGGDKIGRMVLAGWLLRVLTHKRMKVVGLKPNRNLSYIDGLFESGKLVPVIDSVVDFMNVREALGRFRRAEHTGKIVIALR
jgi:NADPH:quinone reductase-like Zn-dependent oxidoreductase